MSVLLSLARYSIKFGSVAAFKRGVIPPITKNCNRSIFDLSFRRFFPKNKYDGKKLVYENNNGYYVGVSHASVTSCALLAIGWNIYSYLHPENFKRDDFMDVDYPEVLVVITDAFLLFMLFGINYIRRKSLHRITYDPKKKLFEAKLYDFFLRNKCMTFKPGEVKHLEIPKQRFKLVTGNFVINNRRFYMHTHDFKNPLYYNIMLGQHNPMTEINWNEVK